MKVFGRTPAIAICLVGFVFAVLAGADAAMFIPTGGSQCELKFPKWLGCVIGNHENLSGGLIGSAGTLFAGWLAWTAIQLQIASEQKRASADRVEVENVLKADIDSFAEALGSIWKILEGFKVSDSPDTNDPKIKAVAYGIEMISRESWLSTSRRMVEALGWERRRKFEALFDSLTALIKFKNVDEIAVDDATSAVAEAAIDFELLYPDTHTYFEGRFRRSPKAWSMGYAIEVMAGVDEK